MEITPQVVLYAVIAILAVGVALKVLREFSNADGFGKAFMVFVGIVILAMLAWVFLEVIIQAVLLGILVVIVLGLGYTAIRAMAN